MGTVGLIILLAASLALPFIPTARAVTADVTIASFAFSPTPITINVGDSVKWTNNDGVTHTVTSDTGAWTSHTLAPGASVTIPFATAGTFDYHCSIHTYMHGAVIVNGAVPEFSSGPLVFIGMAVILLALTFFRRVRK